MVLWENRRAAFPNLVFGPGVEANLRSTAGLFSVIVGKLVLISQSADEWVAGWRSSASVENEGDAGEHHRKE